MQIYHVVSYGASLEMLKRVPPRTFAVLVSAWNWIQEPIRMREAETLLRELSSTLLVDSGAWGALKARRRDYLAQQDFVFELGERLQAERVAAIDVPMMPELLAASGLTRAQALEITVRNAEMAAKARVAGLGLTNQGHTLEERSLCHEGMQPFYWAASWVGVGSVAKCKPPGLYTHVEWVRQRIPHPLHCFGVGYPHHVRVLQGLGVNSVDSSTAALAAGYNTVHWGPRRSEAPRGLTRNLLAHSLLIALNACNIEAEIGKGPEPLRDGQLRFSLDDQALYSLEAAP